MLELEHGEALYNNTLMRLENLSTANLLEMDMSKVENCLSIAYVLSRLSVEGVKSSDHYFIVLVGIVLVLCAKWTAETSYDAIVLLKDLFWENPKVGLSLLLLIVTVRRISRNL